MFPLFALPNVKFLLRDESNLAATIMENKKKYKRSVRKIKHLHIFRELFSISVFLIYLEVLTKTSKSVRTFDLSILFSNRIEPIGNFA